MIRPSAEPVRAAVDDCNLGRRTRSALDQSTYSVELCVCQNCLFSSSLVKSGMVLSFVFIISPPATHGWHVNALGNPFPATTACTTLRCNQRILSSGHDSAPGGRLREWSGFFFRRISGCS